MTPPAAWLVDPNLPAEIVTAAPSSRVPVRSPKSSTLSFLVVSEKVVRGDAVDPAELRSGEPAGERDGIDADIVELALGFDQLMTLRRELLAAARAQGRGARNSLAEQKIGMNSDQPPQTSARDQIARGSGPRLRDHAEHVAAHAGGAHGSDQRMGVFQGRYEGFVEIEVLLCPGAADCNPAPPLRRSADAADLDFRMRQRLVQIRNVGHAQARGETLVELAPPGVDVALIAHGDDPGARVGSECGGVALLMSLISGNAENPERTVPQPSPPVSPVPPGREPGNGR